MQNEGGDALFGASPTKIKTLEVEPELFQDLEQTYHSFRVLHTSRQSGMSGPQPLSLQDMQAYASLHHIDQDIEDWVMFMQALDAVFLDIAYQDL